MSDEKELTLDEKIDKLEARLDLYVSYRKTFLIGIVRGLGSAFGATIIFALIVILLDRLLDNIGSVPVLDPLIEYIQQNFIK